MNTDPAQKTTLRIRGTFPEIQEMARAMRENMTPAEALLWNALKERRLAGLRFRAQHPAGRFILDFYCPVCKLAVEVDGETHQFQHERDQDRTAILDSYGYHLIRVSNKAVMSDLQGVLRFIYEAASQIMISRKEALGAQ